MELRYIMTVSLFLFAIQDIDVIYAQSPGESCRENFHCTFLSSCKPVLDWTLTGWTRAKLRIFSQLRCGFQDQRLKVCCPNSAKSEVKSNRDLLPEKCGNSLSRSNIFGGEESDLGGNPWMAILGYKIGLDTNVTWACGGSIINNRYVLTAAHCLSSDQIGNAKLSVIRLGEHNLLTEMDCMNSGSSVQCAPKYQQYFPEKIILHPQFNVNSQFQNDIALIRLNKEVKFSAFIQPICLPNDGDTSEGLIGDLKIRVAGWGATETSIRSTTLMQVTLPLVESSKCISTYKRHSEVSQICLGGEKGKDSCVNDSGSPAVVPYGNLTKRYYQVGLVSYGPENCGTEGVPAIYTKVSHYMDWILTNLKP